ncbi:FkbM family methyltransferase [Limnofasciculus baicalensis]|nr:FkbM family methyltransferase [Limnofasciculus baicalensis]
MNTSHNLPQIKAHNPYYDTALPRICKFVKEKQGHLTLIDVGANIGDTVSLITDLVTGSFLCIEPDKKYFELLVRNTENIQNVTVENVLVSEEEESSNISLVQVRGTAYISASENGDISTDWETTTIDKLAEKHQDFLKTNIVKIDTDGYDYKVIRGAKKLMSESNPVLFFELSPNHLTSVGEEPISIFDYLFKMGYSQAMFYDCLGYPLAILETNKWETLSQVLHYASIKKHFYYDVLLFHDLHKKDLQEFYEEEKKLFPKIKW